MENDASLRELCTAPRLFFLEEMSVTGEWQPALHRGEAFCVMGAASLGVALNRTVLGKPFRWVDSAAISLGADYWQKLAGRLHDDYDRATEEFLRDQGHLPAP